MGALHEVPRGEVHINKDKVEYIETFDNPKLGNALKRMVVELKTKGREVEPVEMVKLSEKEISKGKEIIERLKTKYPLKRDAQGRMMKSD